MDRDALKGLLLDGQSTEQFTASLILGFIGLVGSLLFQLLKSRDKINARGGFRLGHWWMDNWTRVCVSILIITVGAAKGGLVTEHFGDWGAMGLGFMTDKAIEALLKLKSSFNFSSKTP